MTTATTTKRKKTAATHLVIDAGNSNCKIAIAGETEVIPSLISENRGDYIRGGFSLGEQHYILGWDNVNRSDSMTVADKDSGKIDYLHLLLAGSLSAMSHVIKPGQRILAHVLTLNGSKKEQIAEAVAKAGKLTVDGTDYDLDIQLAGVYPEAYGSGLYAAQVYPNHKRVAVLDVGYGTLNLSQYFQSLNGLPRRESFSFVPYGVHSYVELIASLLSAETSNGRVDESLIRQALDSNSYRYLSSYTGTNIWEHSVKAAEIWTEQPKVKSFLVQCLRLISSGVPVVLVGGGFAMHSLQQQVTSILTSQGQADLVHVADNPLLVGVSGLADAL